MTEEQKRVLTDALEQGRFDDAIAIFVESLDRGVGDPEPRVIQTPAGHAMTTDDQHYAFNVRPANRVSIRLTRPGWAASTGHDYWYVSIYDHVPGGVDDGAWKFRHVYQGGCAFKQAIRTACDWYDQEVAKAAAVEQIDQTKQAADAIHAKLAAVIATMTPAQLNSALAALSPAQATALHATWSSLAGVKKDQSL